MSQTSIPPPAPPPSPRNGCLTALLIGVGILMLLPGLCAVLIVGLGPRGALNDPTTASALVGFFAIAGGGIALIWWAARRR
ncbi:MAG TPA: hypothetical protein VII40_20430 [Xanthobacteraceae bacterium]|jgi:hypothetical protein